jgi:hypothetical protein
MDWRITSLLNWAETNQFTVQFSFEGLSVPPEFLTAPEGETKEQWIARSRAAIRAVREAAGVAQTEMDERMDQQFSVYNNWERREGSYQMAAMQRAVRALGGQFRITLEHKYNPGLSERVARRI